MAPVQCAGSTALRLGLTLQTTGRIVSELRRTALWPAAKAPDTIRRSYSGCQGARLMQTQRRIPRFPSSGQLGLRIIPILAVALWGGSRAASFLAAQEVRPSFKVRVERKLVLVPVVVRDSKGRTVPDLKKEDFRLFDNGKPQEILNFSAETAGSGQGPPSKAVREPQVGVEALGETTSAPSIPHRYQAWFFDDIHLEHGDVVQARDAADRFLPAGIWPGDRVGLFTASGQGVVDFTNDADKLRQALSRLQPRPFAPEAEDACPNLFPYQAYLISRQNYGDAFELALAEYFFCRGEYERFREEPERVDLLRIRAEAEVRVAAARTLRLAETSAEYTLRGLEQLILRMATLPGQRQIVLISPGFLTASREYRRGEIAERALRRNVVINTVDAKGVFAPLPFGGINKRRPSLPMVAHRKEQLRRSGEDRDLDILRDLAWDTGGGYIHNSNDLDEGFRKVGAFPEVFYVLVFSPQKLKFDGRFHSLMVKLVNSAGYSVQARPGYFAPRKSLEASAQAKEEIEEAIFSWGETYELPLDVRTQFFMLNEHEAKLFVLTRLDLHFMRFRKNQGHNLNGLTVVTALFDRDGRFLTAKEERIELRLADSTLEQLLRSGLNLKSSFELKPGTYLVRQVVREDEDGELSSLNRTVDIHY